MATTFGVEPGKVRLKLAELLEKTIPGLTVDPWDLQSQTPIYASAQFDCCSWHGTARFIRDGVVMKVNLYSYDTMTECIKGIEFNDERTHLEISKVK